jgi:Sec23/Sec24 trunk domain
VAQDLQKGEARLFARARQHYEALGDRLTAAGAALDVFACSLDQVGLAEMRPAVSDSGGAEQRACDPSSFWSQPDAFQLQEPVCTCSWGVVSLEIPPVAASGVATSTAALLHEAP